MKCLALTAMSFFCYAAFSSALPNPKDLDNKSVSKDKTAPSDVNTIQTQEVKIDRKSSDKPSLPQANPSNDPGKTESGNPDSGLSNLLPFGFNKNCPGVVCYKPPSDVTCDTSNDPSLNVMAPIMGMLSNCCPLYMCTRTDGSFFTHFGMSMSKPNEVTQTAATSTASPSSSGTGHAFGSVSSFNSPSSQNYLPASNSYISSGFFGGPGYVNGNPNFGSVPPYGFLNINQVPSGDGPSYYGRHTSSRFGISNGFQNPALPSMPLMPLMTFQAPVFTANPMFPSAWTMRGRRDARAGLLGQGAFGQPSPPFRPQGVQNLFHGMGQQQPQGMYY